MIRYNIEAFVPYESTSYRYSSFVISDNVPSELDIKTIKVFNDGLEDITDSFTITNNNSNNVTVTAKNPTSEGFYNNTYNVEITATLKESVLDNIIEVKYLIIKLNY